jgi:hypothetical protein
LTCLLEEARLLWLCTEPDELKQKNPRRPLLRITRSEWLSRIIQWLFSGRVAQQ